MRRDEELRPPRAFQLAEDPKEGQLPLGRESRLGFIQNIDALFEPIREKSQEGLAMGLLVQRLPAVRSQIRDPIQVAREIVEALGPHEEPLGDPGHPGESEGLSELGALRQVRTMMVSAAPLRGEAAAFSEGFEKRRLAAAVLPNEEGDVGWEREVYAPREGADSEGVSALLELLRYTDDPAQKWRARGVVGCLGPPRPRRHVAIGNAGRSGRLTLFLALAWPEPQAATVP